jgi:hypothetical protein
MQYEKLGLLPSHNYQIPMGNRSEHQKAKPYELFQKVGNKKE